jgi:hypothetical protein
MAQPTVTLKSLIDEEPRVYLLPFTSPEFAKAVAASPYDIIRQATALHPYSAVLVNDSDQDVIAWSINWKGKDAVGADIGQASETGSFFTLPFSPPEVTAHGMTVMIPRRGDADVVRSGWGPWNDRKQQEVDKQIAYFSEYQDITITLEAALFKEGLAVGWTPAAALCIGKGDWTRSEKLRRL